MKELRILLNVILILLCVIANTNYSFAQKARVTEKPRIIVTSDGEIDDQCSMIRFMLYTNECDVEGIISSSSQYHAHDHNWAGDNWIDPDLDAYTKVYPNLVKHDPAYPTPEYLRERIVLGNVKSEGEMEEVTAGSKLIVKVLLDKSDNRPVWLQAWGGMNTIARALKTIEEEHPERMAEVAKKMYFFFIWEQDRTYQDYIRLHWGKYEIPTIISDQFEAIAYRWKRVQPEEMLKFFEGPWMKENILENHGPLCSIYAAHEEGDEGFDDGDFRSEGDSPAFLHTIVTGLRNMESPDWGGWGGRYVRVRENTWLDPVPVSGYTYPSGRWYGNSAWGRNSLREGSTSTAEQRREYFKPMWRWTVAMQNDFAARADWCVKSYKESNHPPKVVLGHAADLEVQTGATVKLSAQGTSDPDGDKLVYRWWQYEEADTYKGTVEIRDAGKKNASFTVPEDVGNGKTIHIICEVTDTGTPAITRYQRVVIKINNPKKKTETTRKSDSTVEIPSMTAHFPLDGGNGTVVTEAVGGLKGTLNNADPAVSWISGKLDGALHLDGNDDRIIFPHNPAFDFADEDFSITFWIRWPKGLPPGGEHILTKGDYEASLPGETGKRWEIYISSRNLRFNIDDNVAKSQIQVSLEPYITGEWVHVAAVRDKNNNRLKLYADDVLQQPSNPGNPGNDGTHRTGSISNPRGLYIGDASREDAPFQGDLDDLRLFRSALTDEQVAVIASLAVQTSPAATPVSPIANSLHKPRVIVTTDGEIDDRSSMVRFLMYASDYDIAGIVQVNSNAQRSGHSNEKWIEEQIEAYRTHLPNLRKHRPGYPNAAQILSVLKVGNENPDDFRKNPSTIDDSEGAQHIIKVLLDDDPRPVHILAWGGANTQANALWQIKEKYSAEEYSRAAEKARLYCIWFQDGGGEFIVDNLPEIKIYGAGRPERDGSWRDVWDYRSVDGKRGGNRDSANPKDIQTLMDDPWMEENIKTGHGELGALYPQSYTSEGDTPSFMPLVDNGLEHHVDYTLGGWGGRAVYKDGNYMEDGADDNNGTDDEHYTFWRWLPAAQNDWAARADWCVASDYKNANHQPNAQVVGGLERTVAGGSMVTLDASPTMDPDGDELTFKWWQYYEADAAKTKVTITDSDAQKGASFVVPSEFGKQVHIILEVRDDGTPPLTCYQRIIFNIK